MIGHLVKKAVIAVFVAAFGFAAPAQAQQRITINQITVSLGFYFVPLMVADKLGYFTDENIDLKWTQVKSGAAGMAALISGEGHFYVAPVGTTAQAVSRGANVKLFAPIMNQYGSNLVVSREVKDKFGLSETTPVAKRIEALKGLRIAGHLPNTSPDLLIRFIAKQQGWDPERDLTIMPITTEAMIPALQNQRIDAFAISSPTADVGVVGHGAFMLFNLARGEYPPLAGVLSNGLVANADWLAKNEDHAARVVRAMWRGIKYIAVNPQKAKDQVQSYFPDLDPKILDAAYQHQLKAIPADLRISPIDIQRNLDFIATTSGNKVDVDIEKVYTNRIVELAERAMK